MSEEVRRGDGSSHSAPYSFGGEWTPTAIEMERRASRKRTVRKNALVAALSSIFVLGTISSIVVTSPGWKVLSATFFDWSYGFSILPKVLAGFFESNVILTLIASVSVAVIGLTLALIRTSRSPALTPFRILATIYVDMFRGIPMLLIILLVGFGVPALQLKGVTNNVFILGIIAVIITYSAYVAEVIRSGILTVHPSQRAAARSLGLSNFQTLRYVVLPQALRRVTPPLLKD